MVNVIIICTFLDFSSVLAYIVYNNIQKYTTEN